MMTTTKLPLPLLLLHLDNDDGGKFGDIGDTPLSLSDDDGSNYYSECSRKSITVEHVRVNAALRAPMERVGE